jgi:ribosome maturation factor RimP
MASEDPAVGKIWAVAEPLLADEGMEIVDIELRREGRRGGRVLRFYLDKPGGPTLDELTHASRRLNDILDTQVDIEGPYTLEVSSPGVNRTLKKPAHFARFVGKRVRVRTRRPLDGRRGFLGVLQAVQGDGIVVLQDKSEVLIPLSEIERANYEHDWSAECSKI